MMAPEATGIPPGLLRDFQQTGMLAWGDVHVARWLGYLYGESDQRVWLALALTVRALRAGSTCVEFSSISELLFDEEETAVVVPEQLWPEASAWLVAVESSPMVHRGPEEPGNRPLRLVNGLLYLERYWADESLVAAELRARLSIPARKIDAEALRGTAAGALARADADQREAASVPCVAAVTVIAGGPGTGKTHTLARLLAMTVGTSERPPRIALAAPTGKAAVRMEEALALAVAELDPAQRGPVKQLRAGTLHRLLGWSPESSQRFVHDRENPLPHDLIVIDEASMVSVTLMARLLEAIRPDARLVLIGDPDQLAPVEAGAVLSDIVEASPPAPAALASALAPIGCGKVGQIVRLRHNYRSSQAITELAGHILAGHTDHAVELLGSGVPGITWSENWVDTDLRSTMTRAATAMRQAASEGRVGEALDALDRHRLLCAHRRGPAGVAHWTAQVERWLSGGGHIASAEPWYLGRPVLVTANAPDLGAYNGDTGVVIRSADDPRIAIRRGTGEPLLISPWLLEGAQTVHAMTIHKAQGSQFDQVSVILPDPDSPLLTRELLYTAVTRAQSQVLLIGPVESLRRAIEHRARRASGLSHRL